MDWLEAVAILSGVKQKVQMFAMRSIYSGAGFHCVFHHATQQAFLAAHEEAFAYFGGVFAKLQYDNLGSAVKKILRGRQREETERWHGFRAHWGFESSYCNVARGNEKGGVEGDGGWYRRNWLVPLPEAVNLEALNGYLRQGCVEMLDRVISGRTVTTGEAFNQERSHLQSLAAETFELEETTFPQVDGKGCVNVRTSSYSTPCRPSVRVMAKLWPSVVAIGRKNWIHVGSQQAGPKVAAILSTVESCRPMKIPIRDYLAAVLPGMADISIQRLADLAPAAWAARQQ